MHTSIYRFIQKSTALHVLSCAVFVNAGSLLVTSEQNSILCQGVDYICPPKFQHVFIRELFFFFDFFFSCESFVAFFLSPSFPSFFRVTFCLTKDVKKHKKTDYFFACKVCVRPYWYTFKRFERQLSRWT